MYETESKTYNCYLPAIDRLNYILSYALTNAFGKSSSIDFYSISPIELTWIEALSWIERNREDRW